MAARGERRWFEAGVARGVALIALLGVLMTVIEIPFDVYRTFVIEARFGFNKMTPRMFIVDGLKHAALGAALGIPLVASMLWLMERMGEAWWLYAWLVWIAFNLAVLAVYPTWIAPLFNKFTPLEDAQLKERIERLLGRCGFKVRGPHGDGRLAAVEPRQRLFHRLRQDQAHRVLRHPARAAGARRGRGGAGARARPFQAQARHQAHGVDVRGEPRFPVAARAADDADRGSTAGSASPRRRRRWRWCCFSSWCRNSRSCCIR